MSGAAAQYFSLRWNNHPVNLVSVFTGLYQVGAESALLMVVLRMGLMVVLRMVLMVVLRMVSVVVLRVLLRMVVVQWMGFNLSPRRSHW